MAEAIRDGCNRKIEGASRVGCKVIEMHPVRTATGAIGKQPKNPTMHPTLMFHYRVFGGLKAIFAAAEVAICCILLTNCCRRISRVKTVADCSQTVCNLLHSADPVELNYDALPAFWIWSNGAAQRLLGWDCPTTRSTENRATPVIWRLVARLCGRGTISTGTIPLRAVGGGRLIHLMVQSTVPGYLRHYLSI